MYRRLDKNYYSGSRDALLFPNNYHALLSRRTVYILVHNGSLNLFGTHLRRCELCHQENNIDRDHVLECYSTIIDNLSVKSHFLKLLTAGMKQRRAEHW